MFRECDKPKFESKNIILNFADKLDYLADDYREKQTTGSLIEFIHFRADCVNMICKMLFGGIYDFDEVYKIQVYLAIVTDELGIFDDNNKSVPQPEFVEQIKKWRSRLNR
jgi:hypothetical protein